MKRRAHAAEGLLLGTAVADAIGLPREGLSARRGLRMFGDAPLEHRFLLGRGMVSDDTEHACMVAQALLASGGDPAAFARSFAWQLRGWILCLPAGVGLATLRATMKLWLGFPPASSGVVSAGNGAAMRAPILGVYALDDERSLEHLVAACTAVTHRDPRALQGSMAVALAAREAAHCEPGAVDPAALIRGILPHVDDPQLANYIADIPAALHAEESASTYAARLGLEGGVSGFVNHTVPVALYCWLRHPTDFRAAVEAAILLGGDTDTVAAITGALAGASLGADAIPTSWLDRLIERPRSTTWLRRLAARIGNARVGEPTPCEPLAWWLLLPRNLLFLVVVLLHGLRRLLPPF